MKRSELVGASSDEVLSAAGLTFRQLDHWCHVGYLKHDGGEGPGRWRRFADEEVRVASVMARLVAAGVRPEAAHRAARNGGELGAGVRVVLVGDAGSVLGDPAFDVLGVPDLAHGEGVGGGREVGSRDELLDALAADAEPVCDLGGAHQVMHVRDHRHETSGHLTSGAIVGKTSHMTSTLSEQFIEVKS